MRERDIEKMMAAVKPPVATAQAKADAVNAALTVFHARKNSGDERQGSAKTERLTEQAAMAAAVQNRETKMRKSFLKSHYLMPVVALGVVGVASVFSLDAFLQHNKQERIQAFLDPFHQSGQELRSTAQVAQGDASAISAPPTPEFTHLAETVAPVPPAAQDMAAASAATPPVAPNVPLTLLSKQKLATTSTAGAVASSRPTDFERGIYQGVYGTVNPMPPAPYIDEMPQIQEKSRDNFSVMNDNPALRVAEAPVSTFSIDVDTSSYSFVRRMLTAGQPANRDAVRTEELINYFDYNYALPESREEPFAPQVTVYPNPWNENTKLMHIGIKGYDIPATERPRANLVFLVDVSGSMQSPDKLPLAKSALRMLVDNLKADDRISIVVYAGQAATVLGATPIGEGKERILRAIDNMAAGGGTAGGQGIQQAYDQARDSFVDGGINRVIMMTDGDFNVGITEPRELQNYVEQQRGKGIFLSILGFGQGNYNDALMQRLAQNGNGVASYIDNLNEARRVLVDHLQGTLFTIAKDVKIQVEFNPAAVAKYRLIGYETRLLNREDFNNDRVDAGDVGAGASVTAIYEITPVGSREAAQDDLRYRKEQPPEVDEGAAAVKAVDAKELAFLKIRYKLPDANESKLITQPVETASALASIDKVSTDVRFATAVAGFGQLLRGSQYLHQFGYDDVVALANGARGDDPSGLRAEFVNLARLAKAKAQ